MNNSTFDANNIGRRIVDMSCFIKSIMALNKHEPFQCGFGDMQIVGEHRVGLISCFRLQCKMCNLSTDLHTENPSMATEMNLNSAAVLATLSIGCGDTQMVEQQAIMNIPQMSFRQYSTHNELVSNTIYEAAWESMEEAGMEELQLAKDIGEVDEEGNGLIAVIVDGAWSKWSYKVNYNALSGVVSIYFHFYNQ